MCYENIDCILKLLDESGAENSTVVVLKKTERSFKGIDLAESFYVAIRLIITNCRFVKTMARDFANDRSKATIGWNIWQDHGQRSKIGNQLTKIQITSWTWRTNIPPKRRLTATYWKPKGNFIQRNIIFRSHATSSRKIPTFHWCFPWSVFKNSFSAKDFWIITQPTLYSINHSFKSPDKDHWHLVNLDFISSFFFPEYKKPRTNIHIKRCLTASALSDLVWLFPPQLFLWIDP